MNPGIRILPLSNSEGLLEWRMSVQKLEQLILVRTGKYPSRRMNTKWNMWKENGDTTKLQFYLKGAEILHQGKIWKTSRAFSITSPDLLTSSIPVNQSILLQS